MKWTCIGVVGTRTCTRIQALEWSTWKRQDKAVESSNANLLTCWPPIQKNCNEWLNMATPTQKRIFWTTHRCFYTQMPFTHITLYAQTLLHTHALLQTPFFTQTILHKDAFTHRHFDTQKRLRRDTFTHTHLLRNSLSNYWCGMHRTCKNTSVKPDRHCENGSISWRDGKNHQNDVTTCFATASRCVTTVPFSWRDGQNHQMMWPPAMQQHPGASIRFLFLGETDRITKYVTTSYATASRCITTVPFHGETDRITKWCDHQLCNSIQVRHYGSISWRDG